MKGTIRVVAYVLFDYQALIPVPVKGTITSISLAVTSNTILIPVPMKGTILIKLGFPK